MDSVMDRINKKCAAAKRKLVITTKPRRPKGEAEYMQPVKQINLKKGA